MNSDLYSKLVGYFTVRVEHIKDRFDSLPNDALLRFYAAEWDRYTTGARFADRVFTCLNGNWVKHERNEGRKGIYPSYTLALVQWRANFFRCVCTKLVDVILRLIERERNGETIDQDSLKKVVDSFVSLGFDEEDINKVSLDVYKEHLETPFLDATEKFYVRESNEFQALAPSSSRNLLSLWRLPWYRHGYCRKHDLFDYLKMAEGRLKEEEDRVDRYLNPETRKQLISMCELVLILPHPNLMRENFQSSLDFDIPDGLEPLRKTFEEHLKKACLVAVEKLLDDRSGGADLLDPKAYCTYNKHDTLSLEELNAATTISKDMLSLVLTLLVKTKVLINEETDQYGVNSSFKSKKIRINFNQPIKAEAEAECSEVLKTINDDRKYARKTMKHQLLIQEMVSQRFAPKIPDIKKAIDTLLEKEYIERVDGTGDKGRTRKTIVYDTVTFEGSQSQTSKVTREHEQTKLSRKWSHEGGGTAGTTRRCWTEIHETARQKFRAPWSYPCRGGRIAACVYSLRALSGLCGAESGGTSILFFLNFVLP
ncbi:Cullin repeat-containing protein [Rhizopogon salebrosus TDB-379]|nr:Cullin repeat-containing protein [Rhizopogon salebrosus TDB-379]